MNYLFITSVQDNVPILNHLMKFEIGSVQSSWLGLAFAVVTLMCEYSTLIYHTT